MSVVTENQENVDVDSTPSDSAENDIQVEEKENKADIDLDCLLSATLIQDAVASRNMAFKTDERSIRSYIVFKHTGFKVFLYACLWGNICLTLFEFPAVVAAPYWATMTCEAIFLTFFAVRLGHASSFQEHDTFRRDPKNLVVFLTIFFTVIDIVTYCLWLNLAPVESASKAVRWSRPLRPLVLVNIPEGRQLRKAFRNIRRTLPDILHVLVLFFASIALFSLLAFKLFQNRNLSYPNGTPYFQNYWDGFWDLYVLVTSANNPDVKMPSYDVSTWYAIFFVIYLLVNLYVFMNIVLAVIYNNYKKHLKNEVQTTFRHKQNLLSSAFDLIKTNVGSREFVTKEQWQRVMTIIDPGKDDVHVDLLLSVLDTRGNNVVEKQEFMKVADLLNIELKVVKEKGTVFERCCPPCYNGKSSEMLKTAIRSRYFQWFFDLLTLINAVCIGLNVEVSEWFFLAMFTVEIILKMYALGPKKYFTAFWNIFDFTVISAAWAFTVGSSVVGQNETRALVLDILMVLRILRLVRLATTFERFKVILITIVNIGPSITTYGTVIFVVFYIYAVIGMEVFHGRVLYMGYNQTDESSLFCGNPLLNGSEFAYKRYCSNNFNNMAKSMFLLFDLLVVNQWHVLAEGFVLVTSKAARFYFISFHVICAIILLNIFTAFILEAFMLEYSLSKGHLESVIETRIKQLGLGVGQKSRINSYKKSDRQDLVNNMEEAESSVDPAAVANDEINTESDQSVQDHGRRFSLKKNRSKRLETLLQLMFEASDDLVPSANNNTDQPERNVRNEVNTTEAGRIHKSTGTAEVV